MTSGANQAFINVLLCLSDHGDRGVLFVPYYFNHMMAFQMAGVTPVLGPCTPDLHLGTSVSWQGVH